jgi:hypothetical protein
MKNFVISLSVFILLLVFLEISARGYISLNYGKANAGLVERSVNLDYRPFTMWGPNFDKQSKIFRENNLASSSDYVILIMGGSTGGEFSANERGQGTIEKAFKSLVVNDSSKVRIFNTSVGGFNIRQEISALMMSVEKIQPDLIIVLDGANDIQHAMRDGVTPGTTFVDGTYAAILKRPYMGPFFYVIQHSQFLNGLIRYVNRHRLVDNENSYDIAISESLAYYLGGRDFIDSYATGAEIDIVFMLQPHVAFSKSSDDIDAKKRFAYRSSAVEQAFREVALSPKSEQICFIDANKDLAQSNLSLGFIDDVHFKSIVGYTYIANLFFETYLSCYTK